MGDLGPKEPDDGDMLLQGWMQEAEQANAAKRVAKDAALAGMTDLDRRKRVIRIAAVEIELEMVVRRLLRQRSLGLLGDDGWQPLEEAVQKLDEARSVQS